MENIKLQLQSLPIFKFNKSYKIDFVDFNLENYYHKYVYNTDNID